LSGQLGKSLIPFSIIDARDYYNFFSYFFNQIFCLKLVLDERRMKITNIWQKQKKVNIFSRLDNNFDVESGRAKNVWP